jgi:16S rRNA (cytidine1402-2'-O)-methyltransferase
VRGTLQEVIEHFSEKEPKGEIVIILEGAKEKKNRDKESKYNKKEED